MNGTFQWKRQPRYKIEKKIRFQRKVEDRHSKIGYDYYYLCKVKEKKLKYANVCDGSDAYKWVQLWDIIFLIFTCYCFTVFS